MKINYRLLPVKAHFFFFMAASGPILPYLTVYGKQLGISEVVMGSITAVLPLLFLLAKPVFGFVVDYFQRRRKVVFMTLVCCMSAFYVLLYFVPPVRRGTWTLGFDNSTDCAVPAADTTSDCRASNNTQLRCLASCPSRPGACELPGVLSDAEPCLAPRRGCPWQEGCNATCVAADNGNCFYHTPTFYGFVVLMSLAMIAYNVANSISDAICFDMLGEGQEMQYGRQRVWGAIGFGLTALLGGLGMDLWSGGDGDVKNYTPAFILVLAFTLIDMLCCLKLKLPKMGKSENILKDMGRVLNNRNIVIFLGFATLAGMLDSFIIYFMFWFLEDLAKTTNEMSTIKLLEGLTVAAETLGGEVIFFPLSGRLLTRLGYGHALSICFFNYALRLGLISVITSPWWILPVELVMQGPTYALCYTTIVAYASAVSPPGTSATMQGLVAGMDDGFGYAIGSLIGGFLYRAVGGRTAFQAFSMLALLCCVTHCLLYKFVLSKPTKKDEAECKVQYLSPAGAAMVTQSPSDVEKAPAST